MNNIFSAFKSLVAGSGTTGDDKKLAQQAGAKHALNQVDLCFVVDTTSSMSGFLAAARAALVQTLTALKQQSALDLRVGLIEFRDHPPQDTSFVTRHYEITDDLAKIERAIEKLRAEGGGDIPEAVFDAVHEAAVFTVWRAHGGGLVLLVGEARPHGYEQSRATGRSRPNANQTANQIEHSRVCTCGLRLDAVTAAAEENRVVVQTLPISADATTRFAFDEIAQATGGISAEAADAKQAIERIETLLAREFAELPFDQTVLQEIEKTANLDAESIANSVGATRRQVANSLARLGRRGFLNG